MEHAASPDTLWCEDCDSSHGIDCPRSGPPPRIHDRKLTRAAASLPECLSIAVVGGSRQVVAAAPIIRRTQFGPLEARREEGDSTEAFYKYKIFQNKSVLCCLDTRNEEGCNWMSLVSMSVDPDLQNLASIQHGGEIYFLATRNIQEGEVLRVWYSPSYAARVLGGQQGSAGTGVGLSLVEPGSICERNSEQFRAGPHLQGGGLLSPEVSGSILSYAARVLGGQQGSAGTGVGPSLVESGSICEVNSEQFGAGPHLQGGGLPSPEVSGSIPSYAARVLGGQKGSAGTGVGPSLVEPGSICERNSEQFRAGPHLQGGGLPSPEVSGSIPSYAARVLGGQLGCAGTGVGPSLVEPGSICELNSEQFGAGPHLQGGGLPSPEVSGSIQSGSQCDNSHMEFSSRIGNIPGGEAKVENIEGSDDSSEDRGCPGSAAPAVVNGDHYDSDTLDDTGDDISDHSDIDGETDSHHIHCPAGARKTDTDKETLPEVGMIGTKLDDSAGMTTNVPPGREKHSGTKCPLCHSLFRDMRHHLIDRHNLLENTVKTFLISDFSCPFCSESFMALSGLHDHMMKAHISLARDPLRCAKCLERFEDFTGLQSHELGHTSLLTAVCHECGRRVLKVNIDEHVSTEHSNGLGYKCRCCNESLSSFNELKQHLQNVKCHGEVKFENGGSILRKHRKRKFEGNGRERHVQGRMSPAQGKAEMEKKHVQKRTRADPDREENYNKQDYSVRKAEMVQIDRTRRRYKNQLGSTKICIRKKQGSGFENSTDIGNRRGYRIGIGDCGLANQEAGVCEGFVTEDKEENKACRESIHLLESGQGSQISPCGVRAKARSDGARVCCRFCDFDSSSSVRLQQHVLNMHTEVDTGIPEQFKHPCDDCGRVYLRLGHLTRHMQTHLLKQFDCKTCQRQFATGERLELHKCCDDSKGNSIVETDGEKETLYDCKVCGRKFTEQKVLSIHIHTHFRNIPNGHSQSVLVEEPTVKDNTLSCSRCHYKFSRISAFSQHHRRVHKVEIHLCCICYSSLSSREVLLGHLANHADTTHSRQVELQSMLGDFLTCEHCFAIFPNASTLKRHIAVHLQSKDFICDRCGKMFHRKDAMEAHTRIHDQSQSYICQICRKSFRSQRSLRVHFGCHQEERHYQCHICSREFRQQGNLNKHLAKCVK